MSWRGRMTDQTSGWRPIDGEAKRGLPVLVSDGREVWKSEWDFVDGYWPLEDEWCGQPTHWQPLPELPDD